MKQALRDIGLSEKQVKLYLASLSLGPASVQQIAKQAGLPRSSSYELLDSLVKLGFISRYKKKSTQYFSPSEPKTILSRTEKKVDELKKALPELEALYGQSSAKPSVRFYQGKEGMQTILEEIIAEASEVAVFGSADMLYKELLAEHQRFVEGRLTNRIQVRALLNDSPLARERKRLGPTQLRIVRTVPDRYICPGFMYIWNNKIAMFSLGKEFTALVTESKELATLQLALYNHMWDAAEA